MASRIEGADFGLIFHSTDGEGGEDLLICTKLGVLKQIVNMANQKQRR